MKKLILITITCFLLIFSCKRAEPEPSASQIIIKKGETKSLEVDDEAIPIKLVGVNVVFTEGLLHAKGHLFEEETLEVYRIYDATISMGSDTLNFRTSFTQINGQPYKEKSWADLSGWPERFIRTFKSYQIGIANIYSQPNDDPSVGYAVKLLIKK